MVERFTKVVHSSREPGIEEVCRDNVEGCTEDCGAVIAKPVTCESFYIGEEEPCPSNARTDYAFEVPCEEQHCNNTGKDCVWNTNADEFSPMFGDSNTMAELWDLLHCGSATDSENYEVVYS